MNETKKSFTGRNLVGLVLIIVGGLFLLRELGIINRDLSIPFWPTFLLVVGCIIIVTSQRKTFGVIIAAVGLFFLLPAIFPFISIQGKIIFPVLIIVLGLYIIFKHRSEKSDALSRGDLVKMDTLDEVAIFGGGQKIIYSDTFRGGNITSIFGGSEIDLTNCKLAEGNQVIDVLFIFGGSEIIVPTDWNVLVSVTPIFGGFSNKSRRDPNIPIDKSRTLIVKGLAMFGGGEVKSR
jgi:predicted membrane protein